MNEKLSLNKSSKGNSRTLDRLLVPNKISESSGDHRFHHTRVSHGKKVSKSSNNNNTGISGQKGSKFGRAFMTKKIIPAEKYPLSSEKLLGANLNDVFLRED